MHRNVRQASCLPRHVGQASRLPRRRAGASLLRTSDPAPPPGQAGNLTDGAPTRQHPTIRGTFLCAAS
jgi:hypothetical protein